jgi:hypothetical protein
VPDDKTSLVDSAIALYFILMRKHRDASLSKTGVALLDYINQNKLELFPTTYFDDLVQISEGLAYRDEVRIRPLSPSPSRSLSAGLPTLLVATK